MPRHPGLPRPGPVVMKKRDILAQLSALDGNERSRARVLAMESDFRSRIDTALARLPIADSPLSKFATNPYVLLFHSKQQGYSHVAQIERDLVPAKVFSSLETSAGKMVEEVVLPIYGWDTIESTMHSRYSVLDGSRLDRDGDLFEGATLKSGPNTLNDSIAQQIGADIARYAPEWASDKRVERVAITYGTLYGTKKQSNKKDWHILRNIDEARPERSILRESHMGRWGIRYEIDGLDISARVRVGLEWWKYLGDELTWLEVGCALIRACIAPTSTPPSMSPVITELARTIDLSRVASRSFNVSILQWSQLEWLLFLAYHFTDVLEDG